jgi:hypothetical protein
MANADSPKGLRPYERALRLTPYVAGSTVYPGDAVTMANDGAVDSATAAQALIGVAAHYATAGQDVMVWDDPEQKFVVQADNGTTLAQTGVGLNYDIVATAANTTYKQSRMELDSSSGATSSILPLRMLGVSREVDEVIGEFAKCVVIINNHQLGKQIVGL